MKNNPEKKMSSSDLFDLVRLTEPKISPDGSQIAVIVSRANLETNKFDNQLVMVSVKDREQKLFR